MQGGWARTLQWTTAYACSECDIVVQYFLSIWWKTEPFRLSLFKCSKVIDVGLQRCKCKDQYISIQEGRYRREMERAYHSHHDSRIQCLSTSTGESHMHTLILHPPMKQLEDRTQGCMRSMGMLIRPLHVQAYWKIGHHTFEDSKIPTHGCIFHRLLVFSAIAIALSRNIRNVS